MPFVLGINTTGFPFFVILAPNWEAGAKRRQSSGGINWKLIALYITDRREVILVLKINTLIGQLPKRP